MIELDIHQITRDILIKVGGFSGLLILIVGGLIQWLTKKKFTKYKGKIDKELEEYKNKLQIEIEKYRTKSANLTFVTKLQFETEFKAYKKIFAYMYDADIYTRSIFPSFDRLPEDKEAQEQVYNNRFEEQLKAIIPFYDAIEQHAPFINLEIYEKLLNIRYLIHSIRITAEQMLRNYLKNGDLTKRDPINDYHDKLEQAVKNIRTDVRNYLATLKIQE